MVSVIFVDVGSQMLGGLDGNMCLLSILKKACYEPDGLVVKHLEVMVSKC